MLQVYSLQLTQYNVFGIKTKLMCVYVLLQSELFLFNFVRCYPFKAEIFEKRK